MDLFIFLFLFIYFFILFYFSYLCFLRGNSIKYQGVQTDTFGIEEFTNYLALFTEQYFYKFPSRCYRNGTEIRKEKMCN